MAIFVAPRGETQLQSFDVYSNRAISVSTGLLAASPYHRGQLYQPQISWKDQLLQQVSSPLALAEIVGTSFVMNRMMRFAMPRVAFHLSRAGIQGKGLHFLLTTVALSALTSGVMTAYQRWIRYGPLDGKGFIAQWGTGFIYSAPAMMMGMGGAQLLKGFGQTLLYDMGCEPIQAAVSLGIGSGLEGCGLQEGTGLSGGDRFKLELSQGLLYMGVGRAVGGVCRGFDEAHGRQERPFGRFSTERFGGEARYLWDDLIEQLQENYRDPFTERGMVAFPGLPKTGRERLREYSKQTVTTPAIVWKEDNFITSSRPTPEGRELTLVQVDLPFLTPEGKGLTGLFADVSGKNTYERGKLYDELETREGVIVGPEEFAQAQCYQGIAKYAIWLEGTLGVDLLGIQGGPHRGRPHPIRSEVNAFKGLNAYYDPQGDHTKFGVAENGWPVGSEQKVVGHESTHELFDHINPLLRGSIAGADHEAISDLMWALFSDNPVMSEDFLIGAGAEGRRGRGLRYLNNDLKLDQVDGEEHVMSEVFGGFGWSVFERLFYGKKFTGEGARRRALDFTAKLMWGHLHSYAVMDPKPADFVDAVLRSARGLERLATETGNKDLMPFDIKDLNEIILDEAKWRGLMADPPKETPPPSDPEGPPPNDHVVARRQYRRLSVPLFFRSVSRTPGLGFDSHVLQQAYRCQELKIVGGEPVPATRRGKPLFVDVIARGMTSWSSRRTDFEVSHRDVRHFDLETPVAGKSFPVDESIEIPFDEAVRLAQKKLRDAVTEALRSERDATRSIGRGAGEDPLIALMAALTKDPNDIPKKLVIVRDEPFLSWAIDLEFAKIFVPASRKGLDRFNDPDGPPIDSSIYRCSGDPRSQALKGCRLV